MDECGFKFKNVTRQYLATFAANLIMFAHGNVVAWFTPSLPILQSDVRTPLITGPLTKNELSWIASINNLGGVVGILAFGSIVNFLGCKRAMIFLAFPTAAFWFLVFFGNTFYHLLFARFLSGWTGGGIQSTLVLYVSQISNDEIRGRLGSLSPLIRNTGVVIILSLGSFLDYHTIPCIFIVVPITYFICFLLLPNTCQFWLKKGKIEEAKNSLKYYKGYKGESQLEIKALDAEFDRLKSLAAAQKKDEKIVFSDFMERKVIKGIFIGIMLSFWAQFAGGNTLMNYAILIAEASGASKIDPNISAIMMGVAQMLGCLFSSKFADLFGRKLLLFISFIGSALGLGTLSLYLYLNQVGYDLSLISWIPTVSLTFIMFISSTGINSLYAVCFIENLPTKMRTYGLMICVLFLYIFQFTFVKMFPILLQQLDLLACMIIFMVGNIIASIYVVFVLQETKGKSLDTLEDSK